MAEQLAKLKAAIAKGDMPPDFRNKTDDELLALLASANELRSSDGSVPDGSAPEDTQCARCARATLPARGMHARPLRAGHVYTHPPCYAGGGRPDPEAKEVREVCAGHRREEQRLWERDPSKRRRCREADAAVSGEASGRREGEGEGEGSDKGGRQAEGKEQCPWQGPWQGPGQGPWQGAWEPRRAPHIVCIACSAYSMRI